MRTFVCDVCGSQVTFENFSCLNCGSALAFSLSARRVVAFDPTQAGPRGLVERPCRNEQIAACNWLAAEGSPDGLCLSCQLTRTRPDDSEAEVRPAFVRAEAAKRRLVYQLLDLGLPVVSWMADRENGLAVDLLSSRDRSVVTGHADGVITLDLAEGDDPHREAVRVELGEAYRTLLGHLRHESGHYYWELLTGGPQHLPAFRDRFGDERADYQQEINRHYQQGPPPGWEQTHVSSYATMHPWEDWAETFAHYLHLRDLLQTAHSYDLTVAQNPDQTDDLDALAAAPSVAGLVGRWLPLSYALNAVNRSIGQSDLYPFVLSPVVIDKLDAVHLAVRRLVSAPAAEAVPATAAEPLSTARPAAD